jgi:glutamate/tyrosine decarboxylase-like PLP-dependent enzyme
MQQTRGFRALKLWLVLQQAGRAGVAAHVERHVALARRLAAEIDAAPDLERLAPVPLSIVCFRWVPPEGPRDTAHLDAVNRSAMEAIQESGEAFVSGTVLRGAFALRACVLHFGTTEADVTALVRVVRRTAALARR